MHIICWERDLYKNSEWDHYKVATAVAVTSWVCVTYWVVTAQLETLF